MHWEMCGNCRIFLHFLLFPLLLSEPPETHKDHSNLNLNAIALSGLTLSRFQINCVRDYVFQFHEFQLESVGYPAIRAVGDPFPLITDDGLERKGCPMHSHCSVTANGSMVGPRHPRRANIDETLHSFRDISPFGHHRRVCIYGVCLTLHLPPYWCEQTATFSADFTRPIGTAHAFSLLPCATDWATDDRESGIQKETGGVTSNECP